MSAYKTDQRRIRRRGRDFHFVSYEGQRAVPERGVVESGPEWFLVTAGKRWAVAPQVDGQDEAAVDRALTRWLDAHVFSGEAEVPSPLLTPPPPRARPGAPGR